MSFKVSYKGFLYKITCVLLCNTNREAIKLQKANKLSMPFYFKCVTFREGKLTFYIKLEDRTKVSEAQTTFNKKNLNTVNNKT